MSQKKTLAGFHFHWSKKKRKNLKKKAHIETLSLCQVLNVYDCKALIQSKRGYTCSAEEGIFPRSSFIHCVAISGRPQDDFVGLY